MRLLKQLDNNITLTQSETTQFITYLTNPEINGRQSRLINAFTKRKLNNKN